jgi:hypothetical protein
MCTVKAKRPASVYRGLSFLFMPGTARRQAILLIENLKRSGALTAQSRSA